MRVQDIMTSDPKCCTAEMSLQEVARMMVEVDCGEIPVCDSQESHKVIGVITDRDITCRIVAEGKNALELTVAAAMSTPVITITADRLIAEAEKALADNQIRRLPVVDSRGRLVGILAQADLVKAGVRRAGEVVRDVSRPTGHASNVPALN